MKLTTKVIRLTSLIFLFSMLVLPVQSWAADGYDTTVSFGAVKGSVGEVVSVPVKISQPKKGIAAYGIEINFNKDQVKVVGIKSGYGSSSDTCSDDPKGCFWSNYNNENGFLRAAWADPSAGDHPIKDGVDLFTIQLEILKTDFVGESNISVQVKDPESLSFTDTANHPLSVGLEAGKLEIVSPAKAEPSSNTEKGKDEKKTSNAGSLPQTGDDSYIDTYLNMGIAVILAALVFMWLFQKRQKAEKAK